MSEPDPEKSYFVRRAEAELELAQSGDHPKVVAAHYRLAELYLDRVYGEDGDVGDRPPEPQCAAQPETQ